MKNSTSDSLVSIIIPLYNSEKYIHKTIESILNQTYKNFELIIVDDVSTDNSIKIINNCIRDDKRIKLIQSSSNFGGPARPRNIGINASKGKYIAFCDNDDIWLPKKIDMQVKAINNSESRMVFSMQKQFGETSIFSNDFGIGPLPFKVNTTADYLLKTNCIPLSSVMIEKSLLCEIGGFDEKKSFIAIEDNDLWIRVSMVTKIGYTPEVLVMHRNHKGSLYGNSDIIDQGMQELCNKHGFVNNKNSIYNFKNNRIYFLFRNIFLLIIENLFYKTKINLYSL